MPSFIGIMMSWFNSFLLWNNSKNEIIASKSGSGESPLKNDVENIGKKSLNLLIQNIIKSQLKKILVNKEKSNCSALRRKEK